MPDFLPAFEFATKTVARSIAAFLESCWPASTLPVANAHADLLAEAEAEREVYEPLRYTVDEVFALRKDIWDHRPPICTEHWPRPCECFPTHTHAGDERPCWCDSAPDPSAGGEAAPSAAAPPAELDRWKCSHCGKESTADVGATTSSSVPGSFCSTRCATEAKALQKIAEFEAEKEAAGKLTVNEIATVRMMIAEREAGVGTFLSPSPSVDEISRALLEEAFPGDPMLWDEVLESTREAWRRHGRTILTRFNITPKK